MDWQRVQWCAHSTGNCSWIVFLFALDEQHLPSSNHAGRLVFCTQVGNYEIIYCNFFINTFYVVRFIMKLYTHTHCINVEFCYYLLSFAFWFLVFGLQYEIGYAFYLVADERFVWSCEDRWVSLRRRCAGWKCKRSISLSLIWYTKMILCDIIIIIIY